jgi:hypothetical protein
MALNSASTLMNVAWDQQKTLTGFNPVAQGADAVSLSVSPALTGATPANIVFAEQRTLSAGGSYTYDLTTGLTDFLGTAINLTRIFAVIVTSSTGTVVFAPGATNGLEWFLGGTSPTISIPAGAGFMFTTPTHQTVSGTDKTITLSSSAGATYKIAFLGGQ